MDQGRVFAYRTTTTYAMTGLHGVHISEERRTREMSLESHCSALKLTYGDDDLHPDEQIMLDSSRWTNGMSVRVILTDRR